MGQSSQTDESHCHLDPARRLEASERLLGTAIHESIDGTSAPRGSGGLQGVERFHEAPQQWNEHGQLQDYFACEPTRSCSSLRSWHCRQTAILPLHYAIHLWPQNAPPFL